ncbi:MAG: hypothetical protein LBQ96_05900 [Fusobacteriaceae bacterium]|nr:hypothetical protein [Fusobacteriaceae bacterium]
MKKKYIIEVVLFVSYALFSMSWKSGDFYIANLGVTGAQTAIMTNAINIAKVIGCLAAAVVIAKLGMRQTYTWSTILVIVGILVPFTRFFPAIFTLRFILGLGGAFIVVAMNPIASSVFEPGELAIVNGLNAVAFNTGLAVALTIAAGIKADPKKAIMIISIILLGFLLLWLILSRGIGDKKAADAGVSQEKYSLFDGLKDSFNLLLAMGNVGLLSFYLIAMTFMNPADIKYVIYAGIIGALAGSFGAKNVKNKLSFVRATALLQLLSAVAFVLASVYGIAVLLKITGLVLGFFIFFPLSAYITLGFIREGATPARISVTFSIFWSVGYLMTVVIMQVFGVLKDKTGGLTIPLIFAVCCEALFFIATLLIRLKKSE